MSRGIWVVRGRPVWNAGAILGVGPWSDSGLRIANSEWMEDQQSRMPPECAQSGGTDTETSRQCDPASLHAEQHAPPGSSAVTKVFSWLPLPPPCIFRRLSHTPSAPLCCFVGVLLLFTWSSCTSSRSCLRNIILASISSIVLAIAVITVLQNNIISFRITFKVRLIFLRSVYAGRRDNERSRERRISTRNRSICFHPARVARCSRR